MKIMERRSFFKSFGLGIGGLFVVKPLWEGVPDWRKEDGPGEKKAEDHLYLSMFKDEPNDHNWRMVETDYPGYERVKLPTGDQMWETKESFAEEMVVNKKDIYFPICYGGSQTITHFGILSKDKELLLQGQVNQYMGGLVVESPVQPCFARGQLEMSIDGPLKGLLLRAFKIFGK